MSKETSITIAALEPLSDGALAQLIHQAETLLEARWPSPPLTTDTAALFEGDRQHPETNAALYHHDFYRWCAQTAHLARQGALAPLDPQTLGRDLLLRAGKLGTAQRALVLQMIEHAERVLQTLPTQPDEPRQAPQSEEPDARTAP
jgi:hypothetical protein